MLLQDHGLEAADQLLADMPLSPSHAVSGHIHCMFSAYLMQVYEETAGLTVGDVVTRTKKVCLDMCMVQGGFPP
jgi:hypothetical protein